VPALRGLAPTALPLPGGVPDRWVRHPAFPGQARAPGLLPQRHPPGGGRAAARGAGGEAGGGQKADIRAPVRGAGGGSDRLRLQPWRRRPCGVHPQSEDQPGRSGGGARVRALGAGRRPGAARAGGAEGRGGPVILGTRGPGLRGPTRSRYSDRSRPRCRRYCPINYSAA